MFTKILVANRGEIAVRIMRSISEMGIKTVAVYSDIDKQALHVACADQAIHLGGSAPSDSYLNIEKIIAAAKSTGAEAIHPGYGFLSENADFANAVSAAGFVFIGPSGDVMQKLGDKISARHLMKKHNVPLAPGMDLPESDFAVLKIRAEEIGYPVLIKASAGGGGKGMRIVYDSSAFSDAAKAASSEAKSAFNNGAIFVEKHIESPRHVEFQILADSHGNCVHLFERECSIQRRHQKIIEETPSVALNQDLRDKMGAAAVSAAIAAGYVNAGTVEFILDPDGNFYFLEVNTRLQVEHPITEMVTGLDLVRLQIEIADGAELPFVQEDLLARGHAIECRIYAEDPEQNFFPSPGTIFFYQAAQGPGIRFDSGIYSGCQVPMHYDPILGKLIVLAETRNAAIERMIGALKQTVVLGVSTSIEFMIELLDSKEFRAGNTNTHFIDDHFKNWTGKSIDEQLLKTAYTLASLDSGGAVESCATNSSNDELSPFKRLGSWDIVD